MKRWLMGGTTQGAGSPHGRRETRIRRVTYPRCGDDAVDVRQSDEHLLLET